MYGIKVISQESGILPDTLRKWETRYGFPAPVRSPNGTRAYTENDLQKLKAVKKLLDQGHRPAKILNDLSTLECDVVTNLETYSEKVKSIYFAAQNGNLDKSLLLLKSSQNSLSALDFAEDICAPLTALIGEGWGSGELPVHLEHALSEQLHAVLSIDQPCFFDTSASLAILTTLSNENHTIGLRIANSILNDAGCRTIYLGAGLPISEIIKAADFYASDYVCISITTNTSSRLVTDQICNLREQLNDEIQIILGGNGCSYLNALPPGVRIITDLSKIYDFFSTK